MVSVFQFPCFMIFSFSVFLILMFSVFKLIPQGWIPSKSGSWEPPLACIYTHAHILTYIEKVFLTLFGESAFLCVRCADPVDVVLFRSSSADVLRFVEHVVHVWKKRRGVERSFQIVQPFHYTPGRTKMAL